MSAADDFRAAVESREISGVPALLAEDIVFHSPVTFHAFEGRDAVSHVLGTVFTVFEDFVYTDHLRDGRTSILVFKAKAGGRDLDGVDIIREGDDGLIEDFTVMVRPLSGLTALGEEMRARLGAPPS